MSDEKELTQGDENPETGLAEAEGAGTSTAVEEEAAEKLQQKVEIVDAGPCRKHIKVIIDRADIDKRLDEKYADLVTESLVPGFRPGKAPREIVVRKFKKDVQEQVRAQLLMASLEQLADDFDVAPLAPPNIDPSKLEIPEKGDFVYEFEVEVRPEFDLPDYKGLKLKRPVKEFSEADVEKEEKRILSRYGQLIPKDGPAELGDILVVDMTTRLGEQEIGTNKEITIRIEDRIAFKDGVASDFGKQTVGAKAGDKKTVDIVMSDAAPQEALRGQTVQAELVVQDVKQIRLPEMDERFLMNFGLHNAEQFRERVRLALEGRLEYQQRQSAREQVLQHIAASATWDLPRDLLVRQARKAMARRVMEMREAGLSDEEITARQRLLQRDVISSTAMALKEHFVLQKIAEVEKIEVDDDDINMEIERLADQSGESPRRVRAQMEKEDLLDTLAAQLIERKALDLILDAAEYEDVPLEEEAGVAAVEQQAARGELHDPTAAPPEEKSDDAPQE